MNIVVSIFHSVITLLMLTRFCVCLIVSFGRWDIEAMKDLPLYMKICYIAMFNFGNELIYDVLKNHGLDVSSYIKKGVRIKGLFDNTFIFYFFKQKGAIFIFKNAFGKSVFVLCFFFFLI